MEAEGSQAPARGDMSDGKPETGETPHYSLKPSPGLSGFRPHGPLHEAPG